MDKTREFFKSIDTDNSSRITYHEFKHRMHDESVVAYFSVMGLDSSDVWDLFKLLDVDHSGEIDLDEFVGGFMRLRGPAKSIDIAKISYDNKQMRTRLAGFMHYMEHTMQGVAGSIGIRSDLTSEEKMSYK